MKSFNIFIAFLWLLPNCAPAQSTQKYTLKDSLQGGLRFERTCFDVLHYSLYVKVDIHEKFISGSNTINFKVIDKTSRIQIDLFENMVIDSILIPDNKISYDRKFNAIFIDFEKPLEKNSLHDLKVFYHGNPTVATRAPWDGGFVFSEDVDGKPFVAVACQGDGASLWFPVKDTQSDEADYGATISVAVPNGVMDVSNGRFRGSEDLKNGYTRWDWEVVNPINTYNITLNIADYVRIHDSLNGLDLDYYVLRKNEEIARKHFEDVKPMLECFQKKFGSYPFIEDGYKLVETPYLGMEHQSAVAYGNKYLKGYLGKDLSRTGIGLAFDFIIIHESGHEWFGNSITSRDIADMWIHESFTTYSESVFVECSQGKEKALDYINGIKMNVANDKPIIGQYGVNAEGSGDMYYKGAAMLATIRTIVNDDVLWWKTLYDYSIHFRHQIIDTEEAIAFLNKALNKNLTPVFDQYLSYKNIPEFELKKEKGKVYYRWKADVSDFAMPLDVNILGKTERIFPTTEWQKIKAKNTDDIVADKRGFFINSSVQ